MRKIIALFTLFAVCMSFTACFYATSKPTNTVVPQTTGYSSAVDTPVFNPETDFNNYFTGLGCLWENDDMYVWIPYDSDQLNYYDKATGDFGVLCPRPECTHPHDENCAAYVPNSASAISYQNGRLYYVAFHHEINSPYSERLYSVLPDGSDKRTVMDIPTVEELGGTPQKYYIHRGVLYISISAELVKDSVPFMKQGFVAIDLSDNSMTVIYEQFSEFLLEDSAMQFSGKYVYFCTSEQLQDRNNHNMILRWDSEEKSLETVMEYTSDSFATIPMNGGFWVDMEQNVYFSIHGNWLSGEGTKVFRVENGEPVEILDFTEEGVEYSFAFVSDGVAITFTNNNGDFLSKTAWIKDHNGETVYKGELPTSFVEDLVGNQLLAVVSMRGNKDHILVEYELTNNSSNNAEHYLVDYDITENGLEYKLLGMNVK